MFSAHMCACHMCHMCMHALCSINRIYLVVICHMHYGHLWMYEMVTLFLEQLEIRPTTTVTLLNDLDKKKDEKVDFLC